MDLFPAVDVVVQRAPTQLPNQKSMYRAWMRLIGDVLFVHLRIGCWWAPQDNRYPLLVPWAVLHRTSAEASNLIRSGSIPDSPVAAKLESRFEQIVVVVVRLA